MKAINRIGGAFIVLILLVAVVNGFQTPTGRPIWDSMWNATATTLDWFRDHIVGFQSLRGHGKAAIGWVATGIVLLVLVPKKAISYQQYVLLLLAGAAVAFVLWNPAVLS